NEGPDAAAALLPDLGPGRAVVDFDVVGVVELPGHPVAGRIAPANLGKTLQREVDVALAAGREDHGGPVSAKYLLALLAHPLRHDDRAAIALHRRHECAGDTRIAGR